jgi:hypothetical protein
MIEWSWRIEGLRCIEFGSWSSERRINAGIHGLRGSRVSDIAVDGRLPELVVALTSRRWIRSFMTADGQPEWAVFLPDASWIAVKNGRLMRCVSSTQPNRPLQRTGFAGR